MKSVVLQKLTFDQFQSTVVVIKYSIGAPVCKGQEVKVGGTEQF